MSAMASQFVIFWAHPHVHHTGGVSTKGPSSARSPGQLDLAQDRLMGALAISSQECLYRGIRPAPTNPLHEKPAPGVTPTRAAQDPAVHPSSRRRSRDIWR